MNMLAKLMHMVYILLIIAVTVSYTSSFTPLPPSFTHLRYHLRRSPSILSRSPSILSRSPSILSILHHNLHHKHQTMRKVTSLYAENEDETEGSSTRRRRRRRKDPPAKDSPAKDPSAEDPPASIAPDGEEFSQRTASPPFAFRACGGGGCCCFFL
jgi:hypothetical protein